MDIKEYIASGIIESYVLGDVTPQEKQEVECMSSIYPEIRSHLITYQKKLEEIATANKIEPPKELKSKVLEAVYKEIDKDLEQGSNNKSDSNEAKIVSINKKSVVWKVASAASFVLFLVASGLYFSGYNSLINEKEQLAAEVNQLEEENKSYLSEAEQLRNKFDDTKEKLAFVRDKNTKKINLAGTDLDEKSQVDVFWNQEQGDLMININNLPQTPSKKQYQLWAIVEDGPMDLGVIPVEFSTEDILKIDKSVKSPAAFAITLEEEGGKPTPNLDALYVIGNV